MRFIRAIKEEERQELERMTRQEAGRVAIRANLILLSWQGYTIPEITSIHRTTNIAVYKWFNRFDEQGSAGLYDSQRPGRPSKASQEVKTSLENALKKSPADYGENCTIWTVALLQTYLKNELSVKLSRTTLRETLHSLDFRWRRPRWSAVCEDPLKTQIMQKIARTIFTKAPNTKIWLQDETKFRTLPPLRQMWMKKGHQVRVPTPKANERFYSYGALNFDDGDWFDAFFDKANSDATIAFLKAFLKAYPQDFHIFIWDQARYHTSKKVMQWLRTQERLSVLFLPKYAAELNPVESIWRMVKQRVAANLTRVVEALKESYQTFFKENDAEALLQTAGLAL